LLGTTIEVLPVTTIDGEPVATGKPGEVARRLQSLYRAAVGQWLEGGGA
jgi:branched-subunit amino acid aminotransferase/4-amino-4-deoxychorismate lyase